MFRYIYIYSRLENSAYGECVKEFPTLRVEPMKGMERGIQKVWFSSYSSPNPCTYNTFIELRFKLRRGDQRSRFLPSYQSLYSGSYPRYTGWNKLERWRICWKMQSKEFQGQFILITMLNLTYSINNYVSHFPTDLFQKRQLPKGIFARGNFPRLALLQRLAHLACYSRSARPLSTSQMQCSAPLQPAASQQV